MEYKNNKYYYKIASPEYIKQADEIFNKKYVNKDKIQTLIAKQRINPAEVSHLDLDFVAKIIKNFENPKFSMENVMIMDDYYNETLCHPAEIEQNQVPAISNTTDTDDGKQIGKGWGGLLNKENLRENIFHASNHTNRVRLPMSSRPFMIISRS